MPLQHSSQDPPSARHSARSAAVVYLGPASVAVAPSHVRPSGQSLHTLSLTYLVLSHAVAVVPSHVWPLGQAVHFLFST